MAFPRGAAAGSGACVTRQSSSIARAVARQASGACARGHGLAGEHEMPRQACRGSESGPGGSPHPLRCPPLIRGMQLQRLGGPLHPLRRSWGGLGGLNGGHPEWVGGGSPARGGSRIMHSSTIDALVPSRAVLRVPYMRSTARPRRIGSVVELCMPAAARPVPGTTAPTLRRPPLNPRAPRHRPGRRPPHLRRPPLSARRPLRRPGGFATTPAGHGRPAERHCGDGPLGILASPAGPAAIPSGGRREAAQISLRPTNTPRRAAPAGR